MKLHIRDGLWLIVVVSLGLAWWNDNSQLKKTIGEAKLDVDAAEKRLQLSNNYLQIANDEADVLFEEVRRLRGVVKSSLADRRRWFELEVKGNKLIAIHPGTSESNILTLDTVVRIETETGLQAERLRHFLTPISELQLGHE